MYTTPFNPFTGQFILLNTTPYQQVNTYADLPSPATYPGIIIVVLTSTGAWYTFNRKEAGMYYSDGLAWIRLGSYISIIDDTRTSTDMVWSSNKVNLAITTERGQYLSTGITASSVPSFINNLDGTITVASSTVALRSDSLHSTPIAQYSVAQATLSLTDGGVSNYIYATYNNGIPIYAVTTNITLVNGSNATLIYVMWRIGTTVHSANQDSIGIGLPNKINSRILNTDPYKISSFGGLLPSETTTPNPRTIVVSAAIVYKGVVPEPVLAFNSSIDLFTKCIHTAGGWVYSNTELVYTNSNYNPNSSGEVAIPNNKWIYILYYRSIGDDKEVFWVESPDTYNTISDARNASVSGRSDLPDLLKKHCLLIGRSLIQQGVTNGTTEPFITSNGYFTTPIPTHNQLSERDVAGNHAKLIPTSDTTTAIQITKADGTTAIINVDSLNKLVSIGDIAGGNYTLFEADGTMVHKGNASVYKDIDFPIIVRTTGTGIPTLTALNGNITLPNWAVNDFNQCESQELIHEWEEGTTCYWHLHLTTNGLDTTDRYVKFELEYGYVNEDGAQWIFPSVVTTSDIIIPANTPTKTMLIMSLANFTPSAGKIGGHVIARLKRVASTGTAPTNNPWIAMLQLHVKCDTDGSRNIGTK